MLALAGCVSVPTDLSVSDRITAVEPGKPARVDGDGWTLLFIPVKEIRLAVAEREGREWIVPVAAIDDPPALVIGANPWRRGNGFRREAVGVVRWEGTFLREPDRRYWALAWSGPAGFISTGSTSSPAASGGSAPAVSVVPQSDAAALDTLPHAVGGFYPLLIDGEIAAPRFPGRALRAARVAVGWDASGERLVILAAGGDRPLGPAGLTTVEAAHLLRGAGCSWAINLDGGRSAYVRIYRSLGDRRDRREGAVETLPRVGLPRVVGPVGIALWYNGAQ